MQVEVDRSRERASANRRRRTPQIEAATRRSTWRQSLSLGSRPLCVAMAQWQYGNGGLTHETKVQDIEVLLRQGIAAFDTAAEVERESKAKAVRLLSERLLRARLKALRARLSTLLEPGQKSRDQVRQLQMREQELHAQGITGIFKEFAFHE